MGKMRILLILAVVVGSLLGFVVEWIEYGKYVRGLSSEYFGAARGFVCIQKEFGGRAAYLRSLDEWGASTAVASDSTSRQVWLRAKVSLGKPDFEMCAK